MSPRLGRIEKTSDALQLPRLLGDILPSFMVSTCIAALMLIPAKISFRVEPSIECNSFDRRRLGAK